MSPTVAFQVWIASQMRAKERVALEFGRLGIDAKDVESAAGLLESASLLVTGQSVQRFHQFLGEPLGTISSGDSYNDRGDIYRFEMWPHHDCVLLSGKGAFGLVEFRHRPRCAYFRRPSTPLAHARPLDGRAKAFRVPAPQRFRVPAPQRWKRTRSIMRSTRTAPTTRRPAT